MPSISYSSITAQAYWNGLSSNNVTEAYMYDATNIRLRELSLGYNFPRTMLAKTPFTSYLHRVGPAHALDDGVQGLDARLFHRLFHVLGRGVHGQAGAQLEACTARVILPSGSRI